MSLYEAEMQDGVYELALADLVRFYLSDELTPQNPAAGAEWSVQPQAAEWWELHSVRFQLLTSAVVANRSVKLRALDGNGIEAWRIGPQAVQAAGATVVYSYIPGLGYTSGVDGQQMGLGTPPLVIRPGWTLGSLTALIDVGDQYSGISVTFRRWSPQKVALAVDWVCERLRSAR